MWQPNRSVIEALVGDGLVLDIGGWADPFPRADYVVDIFPYETRGIAYHGVGHWQADTVFPGPLSAERFTKNTWVVHDVCSRSALPFPDKMFDFVICSHTLEDIRDPIGLCSEIIRVGRAGYIETPSRVQEHVLSLEEDGMVGYAHHRWLVDIEADLVSFRLKPHFLHTNAKYYIPKRNMKRRDPAETAVWLFWHETFEFREVVGYEFYEESESFIKSLAIPRRDYWLGRMESAAARLMGVATTIRGIGRRGMDRDAAQNPELWTWDRLFEVSRQYLTKASNT